MDFETREDRQPQGGKKPTAERAAYFRPMQQGVSNTQACRTAGINRPTGKRRSHGRGASGSDEAAPPDDRGGAAFRLAGTLLVMGAVGLRQVLGGTRGGAVGPALIGAFGASIWTAAVFPADAGAGFPAGSPDATVMSGHGAVHMAAGMVEYLALCAAFVALAGSLAARGHHQWSVASRLVPLAVLAGFEASAAPGLACTAGAGVGLLRLTAVTTRLAFEPVTR